MRFLNEILLSVMEISISTGVVILILLLSAPFLRKLCGYARLRARVVRRGIFVEGGLISEKLPILRKELTLMSSLDRQYKKTGLLTTQFCGGGDRVMKRRFQNILGQSGRKRGVFLLALAACMTLVLGTMTGCTVTQTEVSDIPEVQADEEQTQTEQEISRQEDEVANAYFGGDQERIRDFLADSYDGEIEVYTDTDREVTGMTAIKGLENMEESEIGDTKEISMECSMSNTGEGLLYLTLEMVKQEDGWKIEFYGLEM